MKRTLLILTVILSAFIGAIPGILFTIRYLDVTPSYVSIEDHQTTKSVNFRGDTSFAKVPAGLNFEVAAQLITPAVVHIRTIYGPGNFSLNPLERNSNPEAQSTGSGV